jgi:hypothetical protein
VTVARFLLAFCLCIAACVLPAAQVPPPRESRAGTIVLPPRLAARQLATLAVLDADGRLVPGATVELPGGKKVTTNQTGRATFTAPAAASAFLAKFPDGSVMTAAANVKTVPASGIEVTQVLSFVSLRDRFVVRGHGFRGDADANHVTLGGEAALVLASSPESLVLLPSPKTPPGPAKVAIEVAGAATAAPVTVVAFEFSPGEQPVALETKSRLLVRAIGTDRPLAIEVRNLSPGTVHFLSGDHERLKTLGGEENAAAFDVQGVVPGGFSFAVRLLPDPAAVPDTQAARQFLSAAVQLAPPNEESRLTDLTRRLEKHPKDARKVAIELEKILVNPTSEEFDFWLKAALDALLNP